MPGTTAAIIVIGNEILSGKIVEANLSKLAPLLRRHGIDLVRAVFLKDDVETIAQTVRDYAATYDWIFTSGGIGPTHDDVTMEAVAKAFDGDVIVHEELAKLLHAFYKDRMTDSHLAMARVPRNAALEWIETIRWPAIRLRNVWILAGVPEIFEMKLAILDAKLGSVEPFVSTAVFTKLEEPDLKPLLDAVVTEFTDVEVGSYPKWSDDRYKTKITFDGRDRSRIHHARDAFIARLPPGGVLWVE